MRALIFSLIFTCVIFFAMATAPLPPPAHAGKSDTLDWGIVKVVEFKAGNGNITLRKGEVEVFLLIPEEWVEDGEGTFLSGWHGERWHVARYTWRGRDLRFKEDFLSSSQEYEEKQWTRQCYELRDLDLDPYPWGKAFPPGRLLKGFRLHDLDKDGVEEVIAVSGLAPELAGDVIFPMLYLTVLRSGEGQGYDKREVEITEGSFLCDLDVADVNSDRVDDIIVNAHSSGASGGTTVARIYNVLKYPKKGGLVVDKIWGFKPSRGAVIVGEGEVEGVWLAKPLTEDKELRGKYKGEPYFIRRFVWRGKRPEVADEFFSASQKYGNAMEKLSSCDRSGELNLDISRFDWREIIPAGRLVKGIIRHDFDGDGREEILVFSSNKKPASKHIRYRRFSFLTLIARSPEGKYRSFEKISAYYVPFCQLSVKDVNLDGKYDIALTQFNSWGEDYSTILRIFSLR